MGCRRSSARYSPEPCEASRICKEHSGSPRAHLKRAGGNRCSVAARPRRATASSCAEKLQARNPAPHANTRSRSNSRNGRKAPRGSQKAPAAPPSVSAIVPHSSRPAAARVKSSPSPSRCRRQSGPRDCFSATDERSPRGSFAFRAATEAPLGCTCRRRAATPPIRSRSLKLLRCRREPTLKGPTSVSLARGTTPEGESFGIQAIVFQPGRVKQASTWSLVSACRTTLKKAAPYSGPDRGPSRGRSRWNAHPTNSRSSTASSRRRGARCSRARAPASCH
jgi:hypothetical protein